MSVLLDLVQVLVELGLNLHLLLDLLVGSRDARASGHDGVEIVLVQQMHPHLLALLVLPVVVRRAQLKSFLQSIASASQDLERGQVQDVGIVNRVVMRYDRAIPTLFTPDLVCAAVNRATSPPPPPLVAALSSSRPPSFPKRQAPPSEPTSL